MIIVVCEHQTNGLLVVSPDPHRSSVGKTQCIYQALGMRWTTWMEPLR